MATIAGPKVQVPSTESDVFEFQYNSDGTIAAVTMKQGWAAFFNGVQQIAYGSTRNGPTASRPTSTASRWIGMPYFDTDLGKPVFLKTASTNVWVDGAGTPV